MLKIRVGIERGKIPSGWENVSIEQAVWLQERVKRLPSGVIAYYKSFVNADQVAPVDTLTASDKTELVVFGKEAICRLCGLTPFGLGKVSDDDLVFLARNILPVFVLGVLGYMNPNYVPNDKFRMARRTYYYPASSLDISGGIVPFSGMNAIEFCTVSDLIVLNDLSVASIVIATCCHRKGERYDEALIMKRAERFRLLPMSIYWHIWAAMGKVHEYMKAEFPDCFPKSSSNSAPGDSSASWVNTLMQLIADKPSELEYVQSMPCYDFVRLLSVNIKKIKEEWTIRKALRF